MEKQMSFVVFSCIFFFLLFGAYTVAGSHNYYHGGGSGVKLFVFGDSYADTGNCPKALASSWKQPYGNTFPGKPSGRFSDGRVLTDYIAAFLGTKSPLPYRWRKFGGKLVQHGMNFARGGTGVFTTLVKGPNMTTQINFFQNLLEENVYTKRDLNSSVALVSLAGNDYATYMAHNGSLQGLPVFTTAVNNQLALNLKRIRGLGVQKVALTAMEPLGCLPTFTASSSYQNCSATENAATKFHNQMLQQTVQKLNNESSGSVFVMLDLYSAFMSALKIKENHAENSEFVNPLKPCCVGVSREYGCGSLDENGVKKYMVCNNPDQSFFWDIIHPSQQGWLSVYKYLLSSLHHHLFI
ncbi:GDSL esterase/lipase At5g03610-like [Cornus florida]|uniref:GDSL esterase/lipase At5g03610-like n=1 Tax=Cornus florida TaxID=4283 RepID=UPI0028A1FA85|nr:GDSL esterase/lipase At5g03610-like [Cornus florida]